MVCKTGYPGGEPDLALCQKILTDLDEKTLLKSFSKKRASNWSKKLKTFGITLRKLNRDELPLFKEITSATSDRRDYDDKSLDYYQDFYDSFGDSCEFMVASLNFQDYLAHLETDKAKLDQRIEKLRTAIENNNVSEKKQNQLRELSSQSAHLTHAWQKLKNSLASTVHKTLPLQEAYLFIPNRKLSISSQVLTLSSVNSTHLPCFKNTSC